MYVNIDKQGPDQVIIAVAFWEKGSMSMHYLIFLLGYTANYLGH